MTTTMTDLYEIAIIDDICNLRKIESNTKDAFYATQRGQNTLSHFETCQQQIAVAGSEPSIIAHWIVRNRSLLDELIAQHDERVLKDVNLMNFFETGDK